jgi:transposase, IS5 family
MRKTFDMQNEFGVVPIEKVSLPTNSRDELAPVLAGLQWIFRTPEINEKVFALLEEHVLGDTDGTTGRPGMDLWHILVLGTVRLALNCDYDRLEHIANFDGLVRQILGVPVFGTTGAHSEAFNHRTLSDNVCRCDDVFLNKLNAIIVQHGLPLLKKKPQKSLKLKLTASSSKPTFTTPPTPTSYGTPDAKASNWSPDSASPSK